MKFLIIIFSLTLIIAGMVFVCISITNWLIAQSCLKSSKSVLKQKDSLFEMNKSLQKKKNTNTNNITKEN